MAIEMNRDVTYEVRASTYKGDTKQTSKTWLRSRYAADLESETLLSIGWGKVEINEVAIDVATSDAQPDPALLAVNNPPADPTPGLLDTLYHAPTTIARTTKRRNAVAALFEACEARLILAAYSAKLFTNAKTGEPRAADNAEERKLAIALTLADARKDRQSEYSKLARRMEAANVALAHARDEFEAAQTAARLIVARLRTN